MDSDNNEKTKELMIANRLGLHLRAAGRLAEVAKQFKCEISLEKNGVQVDAKSVVSIMTLECPLGTRVVLRARGENSAPALAVVSQLIENKFGEE